jgi:cytochrome b subunit of formate dehydrogenase
VSFILLALTGMMLKFSDMAWARFLVKFFGGAEGAGLVHRFGAILTFGYFGYHLYSLFSEKAKLKKSMKSYFFGPDSLMFNKKDIKDFVGSVKWFFGKGERPKYGRWTYWEKFDYMAVFWGVAVIGFSGLMLWFPEFFSRFLSGKFINVAQIIHSDEALLAVGFIFTIHFFNTHLRPESFPMDTVIFTGHAPADEYKEDRPGEYEDLEKKGELEKKLTHREFSKLRMQVIRFFGFLFLGTGVLLVILIIYSLLFG